MYGIDLIWVWVDTISIIKTTKEIDSWGLYMCFCGLNTNPIFAGGNTSEVSEMRHHVLVWHVQLWTVMSSVQFQCILDTLLGSGPSSSGRCLKNRQRPKGRCRKWYLLKGLLKVVSRLDSWPRTIDQYLLVGIQHCEVVRVHKFMGNFLHSRCLVVIMANGLIEVRGI